MISSPCVQECTINHMGVCVGCRRTLEEITDWYKLTDLEKQTVLDNIFNRG